MVELVGPRLWKTAHVKHFSELQGCVFSHSCSPQFAPVSFLRIDPVGSAENNREETN